MTNNSGKFVSRVSKKETVTDVSEISKMIPPAPGVSILDRVQEYFGKYWWLWIVLLLIIKINSK